MAFAMFGLLLTGCGSESANSQNNTEEDSAYTTDGATLENTTWSYFTNKDDLTGEVIGYHASLKSIDYRQIDHYNHSGRLAILLTYQVNKFRNTPESSIMVCFTDDDRMGRLADRGSSGFLAVFDNGDVDDTWSYITMGDRKNMLGISAGIEGPDKVKSFINKLKASKQCKIQVRLNEVGNTTFTFNTAGLKWDFDN